MKTLSKLGAILVLGGSLFLSSCAGEYYVADQPAEVVYERPAPPYEGAIWIEGDWVWTGGRYVRARGHWEHVRPGRTWVAGNWHRGPRDYAWHRGHWR